MNFLPISTLPFAVVARGAAMITVLGVGVWGCSRSNGESAEEAEQTETDLDGEKLESGPGSSGDESATPGSASGSEEQDSLAPGGQEDPGIELRFLEAKRDMTDVGLGEVRTYRVRARFVGEGARPKITGVSSSCGCLSGTIVGTPDKDGVEVEIIVEGSEPEDIDGVISILGKDRKVLAEHTVVLLVTSRPFITPQNVQVDPKTREVRITLGCGFLKKAQNTAFSFEDPKFDEALLQLVDWIPDEQLELEYLLKTETFVLQVPESAFGADGETIFEISTVEPRAQTFKVKVAWNKN